MHMRSKSLCLSLLFGQLAASLLLPVIGSAQPVRPPDQPKLDKDGRDYTPLSILPPKEVGPVKAALSRREKAAARKLATSKAATSQTMTRLSENKPADDTNEASSETKLASIDPAQALPSVATTQESAPAQAATSEAATTEANVVDLPKSGIRGLIAHHAAANGVPFHLADAMIKIESRYNPRARNGVNLGLGQINLRTAHGLGYSGSAAGLFDADTNLTYSIKYLAQAYRLAKGDICGAVTRYQNGFGGTRMNGANRAYCAKVKAHVG